MNSVDELAEKEDRLVMFLTLAELAMEDELVPALNEVYQTIRDTPQETLLGQHIVRHMFLALAEFAMQGELEPALDEVYQIIRETPLGQHIGRHLPRAKAMYAQARPCFDEAMHRMVIVQTLCEHMVRDGQPALAPAIGPLLDSLLPEAVEAG